MALTHYERIGGDAAVRKLVDRFYDLMDTLPEAKGIRELHDDDISGSRDKLFWFLSGWMGGPDLYRERFGHPRLRARHAPFAIATSERNQWLLCMMRAMQDCGLPEDLQRELLESFTNVADFMRNVDEPDAPFPHSG